MSETTRPLPPSGWYRDPTGHGDARYWNGVAWTDSVSRGGVTFTAPVPPDQMRVPPMPGSEYQAPPAAPAPAPASAPAPTTEKTSSSRSILVAIALVAAAALVAVLLITLLNDDDDDDDDPGSTTVATAPVSEAPPQTEAPPETEAPPTTGG